MTTAQRASIIRTALACLFFLAFAAVIAVNILDARQGYVEEMLTTTSHATESGGIRDLPSGEARMIYIFTDPLTDVQYLVLNGVQEAAMTPRINGEGWPITASEARLMAASQ